MNVFAHLTATMIADMTKKGATDAELKDAINFSKELMDILYKYDIDELCKKYCEEEDIHGKET